MRRAPSWELAQAVMIIIAREVAAELEFTNMLGDLSIEKNNK